MSVWTSAFSSLSLSSQDPLPELSLCHLDSWALISMVGEDKKSYLQGQVTCDVVSLEDSASTLGAHCDAKGKMWSIFRLFNHNQGYALFQRKSAVATELTEIKKYAVFSKVDITISDDYLFGVVGDKAQEFIDNLTTSTDDVRAFEQGTAVKINHQQWLLAINHSSLSPFLERLDEALIKSDDKLWDLFDIKAGLPRVDSTLVNEHIPQALNLQAVDGISFTKGCYTGQEMIARAKYRGINKRAMYQLSGPSNHSIASGDAIDRQVGEHWRKAGTVVSSYQYSDEQSIVLAVLPNNLDAETQFSLPEQHDKSWNIRTLPYSLESE
ncbi:tRNA-modifying protein YgfZ [Aliivibrio kagoshimensis]|uniref:tRNA-modifying protein YgfZ n=1 Tax=Aliivibrio kagoshimensis TaxID=2910230 RepID=UPI003D0ABE92